MESLQKTKPHRYPAMLQCCRRSPRAGTTTTKSSASWKDCFRAREKRSVKHTQALTNIPVVFRCRSSPPRQTLVKLRPATDKAGTFVNYDILAEFCRGCFHQCHVIVFTSTSLPYHITCTPRTKQQVLGAAEARREALREATEEYANALQDEKTFKKEHTRCIMELSLREGLGQRYRSTRAHVSRLKCGLEKSDAWVDLFLSK